MNKTYILFALTAFLSMISCDNETTEYPKEYTSQTIVDNSIKVYTKDGDISNNATGKDFIERHRDLINELDTKKYEGKIKATYTSSSTVNISFENDLGTRDVHQEGDLIYWEDQEISTHYSSQYSNETSFFLHKLLFYEETIKPVSTGYSKDLRYKHCYYLKLTEGELKYPLVEILFKHENGLRYFSESNNEFDKSYLSELIASDTILVQQYWLELY